MSDRRLLSSGLLNLAACLMVVASARAAEPLQPDQVLLVYNRFEPAGVELANHYAKVRNVPADHLCPLEVHSAADDISRVDFERLIRVPIQEYLTTHRLRDKVRCLVTFYGLPIRVGPQKPWPNAEALRTKWQGEEAAASKAFEEMITELESLSGAPFPATLPASRPAEDESHRLLRAYVAARQAAYERVTPLEKQGHGAEELGRFRAIIERAEGRSRVLALSSPRPGVDRALAEKELDLERQQVRAELNAAYDLLAMDPQDPARERGRQTLARDEGLVTYLSSLQNDLARLEMVQTEASVDSELMLLWWRIYPRAKWVSNPLCWRNRADPWLPLVLPPGDREQPVMIVARLDGPTPLVVQRMIDESVVVEKKGLAGRFYIDARGLHPGEGLGSYDQDLRNLAILARGSGLEVTLDNRPEVYPPRACPGAALYCGWYSLRKYVDAFTFVPGAVGYHIASFEAISLRKPNETGWCRGLMLDGVAGTIGPVAEPYLQSFPRPKEFFGLLLTGRFTLGECYAYSTPWTSWMQMLLGDPLYKPFAVKPAVQLEQVFPSGMIPAEFRPAAK